MNYIRYFENLEKYNMSFKKSDVHLSERKRASQKTKRLTICAMLCAVSTIILLLGNLIGVADISALCIVSTATVFCAVEMGSFYPYLLWLSVSVLAFIILPDKNVATEYFLFAGIYPMIKRGTFRLRQPFRFIVRILYFNLCALCCWVVMKYVFVIPEETGKIMWIATLVLFNFAFVLFDFALNSVTAFYLVKLRSKIHGERI